MESVWNFGRSLDHVTLTHCCDWLSDGQRQVPDRLGGSPAQASITKRSGSAAGLSLGLFWIIFFIFILQIPSKCYQTFLKGLLPSQDHSFCCVLSILGGFLGIKRGEVWT